MNANLPPVQTPETHNIPEIPTREIHESIPALIGLQRFIHERRLKRADSSLQDTIISDHVIKRIPEGVEKVRGFQNNPELKDVVPVRFAEKVTRWHRQKQANKLHHAKQRLRDLNDVYSYKEVEESDYIKSMSATTNAERRAIKNRRILDKGNTKSKSILGTPEHIYKLETERMKPRQRRAQRKDIKENDELNKYIDKLEDKMHRGHTGDTFFGRRRAKKIEKFTESREILTDKIDDLDKLRLLKTEKKSHKKNVNAVNKAENSINNTNNLRSNSFNESQNTRKVENKIKKANRSIKRAERIINRGNKRILRAQHQLGERWVNDLSSRGISDAKIRKIINDQIKGDEARRKEWEEIVKNYDKSYNHNVKI